MFWLFLSTVLATKPVRAADNSDALTSAIALVEEHFPECASEEELLLAALEGITNHLNQIDGHTAHDVLTEAEQAEYENWLQGKRQGVGAVFRLIPGRGILMEKIYANGPADRAGLQVGDLVIALNNHPFIGLSRGTIYEIITQQQGDALIMDVAREDDTLHRFEVDRGTYQVENIESDSSFPNYLYLQFFGRGTTARVTELVENLDDEAPLILDLRDNQGGLIDEMIETAGLFLQPNQVVVRRAKSDGSTGDLSSSSERTWHGRIVIVVNQGTSGIAEAFAGALQDHQLAALTGTQTAGLASEPNFYALGDGIVLKLSNTDLLTPLGRSWGGQGLIPDMTVDDRDLQILSGGAGQLFDLQRDAAIRLIDNH